MALYIEIRVVPSSGRQEIQNTSVGLKCFLKEAPEKGLANQELIRFLAKKLQLTQADITIVAGAATRKKRIKLTVDWSLTQLLHKLEIENS